MYRCLRSTSDYWSTLPRRATSKPQSMWLIVRGLCPSAQQRAVRGNHLVLNLNCSSVADIFEYREQLRNLR